MGPRLTNLKRQLNLAKIRRLKLQLAKEEESLHASLHPEVERVLRGKNLLLWKKLLQDAGYKDLQICDEIIRGVRMTGAASFSEEMAHGAILPTMTEQEVR